LAGGKDGCRIRKLLSGLKRRVFCNPVKDSVERCSVAGAGSKTPFPIRKPIHN
jgi:hypothetical protein